jgi:hypothetical protein
MMSKEQKAEKMLAAARSYAELAMNNFFDCGGLDGDAIEKLDHDLQAWFLFPNLPPAERAVLAQLGYAGSRFIQARSGAGKKMDAEQKKRVKIKWQQLKDEVLYSGLLDTLTALQREIVERSYLVG